MKSLARWVSGSNRSTAVPYTINHTPVAPTTVANVDQRQNGGQWVSLGTYSFNGGTGGNVTISYTVNDADTERVVADAVKFVPSSGPREIKILRSHYYVWSETDSKPYLVNIGLGR